jgi:hypothetical protein
LATGIRRVGAIKLVSAFHKLPVWRVLGLGGCLALGGCAGLTAGEPAATVHVADIINSVKCGLGHALQSEAGRRRLPGTIATVELQLKVVDMRTAGANSPSATGPVIFGWYGPLALPTLSAEYDQSFTVDTIIDLTYRLDGPNVSVCNAAGVDLQDKFGFARWLGDVVAGLSKVSPQGPKGSLDKLTYDATFAVTRSGSGGASVQIVFINAGASVGKTRADTQHLKIVITGPNGIVSNVAGISAVQGVSAKQVGPIPNLSTSAPAGR